jgi:ribonuclease E
VQEIAVPFEIAERKEPASSDEAAGDAEESRQDDQAEQERIAEEDEQEAPPPQQLQSPGDSIKDAGEEEQLDVADSSNNMQEAQLAQDIESDEAAEEHRHSQEDQAPVRAIDSEEEMEPQEVAAATEELPETAPQESQHPPLEEISEQVAQGDEQQEKDRRHRRRHRRERGEIDVAGNGEEIGHRSRRRRRETIEAVACDEEAPQEVSRREAGEAQNEENNHAREPSEKLSALAEEDEARAEEVEPKQSPHDVGEHHVPASASRSPSAAAPAPRR